MKKQDITISFTIGAYGGFCCKYFKHVKVFVINLGFIGIRFFKGDVLDLIEYLINHGGKP